MSVTTISDSHAVYHLSASLEFLIMSARTPVFPFTSCVFSHVIIDPALSIYCPPRAIYTDDALSRVETSGHNKTEIVLSIVSCNLG